MPMHDWTRVEAGIYHDFHNLWLVQIRHALNHGLLPEGFYALTEQKLGPFELDVLALDPAAVPAMPAGAAGGRRPAPAVGVVERAERTPERPRRRVTVRHVSGNRPVAVVELVSPGNTAGRKHLKQFVDKAVGLLDAGIHLLVIDPFRPPALAPDGLHAAVWSKAVRRRKGRKPFAPPAERPLLAASYCAAAAELTAALQAFAVGESVPDVPLYLTADERFVTLPLEATYRAAYPEVPALWRAVLER